MTPLEQVQLAIDASVNAPFNREENQEAKAAITAFIDCQLSHESAQAFWNCWKENGETGKHGFYESTWMSFRAMLQELLQEESTND